MTRKIVQIAAMPESAQANAMLYALCDDGTLWYIGMQGGNWMPEKPIPQGEPEAED